MDFIREYRERKKSNNKKSTIDEKISSEQSPRSLKITELNIFLELIA